MLREYLKQYRSKNNITQKQMAKLLDTNQGYYSQIESGSKKPGFYFINKLAKVLNVEPSFIRSLL